MGQLRLLILHIPLRYSMHGERCNRLLLKLIVLLLQTVQRALDVTLVIFNYRNIIAAEQRRRDQKVC